MKTSIVVAHLKFRSASAPQREGTIHEAVGWLGVRRTNHVAQGPYSKFTKDNDVDGKKSEALP